MGAVRIAAVRRFQALRARGVYTVDFSALAVGPQSIPGVTVTRSGTATVPTGTSTLEHCSANTARIGKQLDAHNAGLLLEGSRTNYVTKSRNVAGMTAGGATSTADYAAGPDGDTLADRQQIATDGQSNQETLSGTSNGTHYVASEFVRSTSGTAQHAQLVYYDGGAAISHASDTDVTGSWRRIVAPSKTQALGGAVVIPSDSRNQTSNGGVNPPAADLLLDFVQCERGQYATSPIVTSGSSVTRSKDVVVLEHAERFVSGGKFRLYLPLRALCSLAQLAYDTALPVIVFQSEDLEAQVWINPAFSTLSVYAGGRSTAFTLPSWVAGDYVELSVQAGGNTPTLARIRVNSGSVTNLVGTGFVGSTATATGSFALLSGTATHPLPCYAGKVSSAFALPSGSAGSSPSGTKQVVCEGNSIFFGYGTVTAPPARLATALGAGYNVTNLAVSGSVIEPAADDGGNPALSARSLQAGAYAAQQSVIVAWEFTNTLATLVAIGGYNAATASTMALDRWRRLVRAYRAMGFQVLTLTMLPRTDSYITAPQSAVVEAARQLVNAVLLSDDTCGDYAWDLTENVNLATVNPTYYNADQVHLTDAGNQEVANEIADAFTTFSL